jgi:hypothetical protein
MSETASPSLRIEFEPEQERTFERCSCCGNITRKVWGHVYDREGAAAAYFVEWTPGHDNEANFDLVIGAWGDGTSPADRMSVAVEYKVVDTAPAFRIIDAALRPYANGKIAERALTREEALQDEYRAYVFAILDAIYLDDPRIDALRPT